MKRLTEKDDSGNWCLRGILWKALNMGTPMTRETYERLYAALWKLMEYEDTGLTPEEIMDGKMLTVWIPVEERLPETEIEVLAQWEKTIRQTNEVYTYLDVLGIDSRGRWYGDHGMPTGRVVAWMPLPEPYRPEELRETAQDAAGQVLQSAT